MKNNKLRCNFPKSNKFSLERIALFTHRPRKSREDFAQHFPISLITYLPGRDNGKTTRRKKNNNFKWKNAENLFTK